MWGKRAGVLAPDRQRRWRTIQGAGKERMRRSFLEAKDVKSRCLQIDVRIFPRSQIIDEGEEENNFKSDVWMYHAAFRRENPVCPQPSHTASPYDQVGPVNV